jgi:hypothetical protein
LEIPTIRLSQLFEINARVWLYSLQEKFDEKITLSTIPNDFWSEIIESGFNWIWLMGIWRHSPLSQEELMKHPGLVKEIETALPTWKPEDVIGSPYSIVDYEINPLLGNIEDLKLVRRKINEFGGKLLLDFVPNHFGIASKLVITNPEYFISTKTPPEDESLYFPLETNNGSRWIAYGKDPYFPPWIDTFQLNYFNPKTHEYMINVLMKLAGVSDGVRCDMAMLCLNDIFQRTWGYFAQNEHYYELDIPEFWEEAIKTVKNKFSDFKFIAEVYWNLGGRLQQMGFDYTYDKNLYDILESDNPHTIYKYLNRNKTYIEKTVSFIENHDEKRAIEVFGSAKSIAAAIIIGTLPGLSLYHQGQLEGMKVKIPVQLRQKIIEPLDLSIQNAYNRILGFTKLVRDQFNNWTLLSITNPNLLAWKWNNPDLNNFALVVVNYTPSPASGNIHLSLNNVRRENTMIEFNDMFHDEIYIRDTTNLVKFGLYVDLPPFQGHLFYAINTKD